MSLIVEASQCKEISKLFKQAVLGSAAASFTALQHLWLLLTASLHCKLRSCYKVWSESQPVIVFVHPYSSSKASKRVIVSSTVLVRRCPAVLCSS